MKYVLYEFSQYILPYIGFRILIVYGVFSFAILFSTPYIMALLFYYKSSSTNMIRVNLPELIPIVWVKFLEFITEGHNDNTVPFVTFLPLTAL